jgi:hypothetical protein
VKAISRTIVLAVLVFSAGAAFGDGLTRMVGTQETIHANSLTMGTFFSKKLEIKQGQEDLGEDIYEFHTKSPFKAFAMSLVIPGSGQLYTGSKIKAGTFLAADALLWTGYLVYHGKGSDKEKEYKAWADQYYRPDEYFFWYENLIGDSVRTVYSHQIYQDGSGNVIKSHEYYENIGKYDQFQVGWDDIEYETPPPPAPGGLTVISPHRQTYLELRKKSNDYFSNASTMAMISIANHLISAFDAAIGAKKYNRGTRQYSLQLKSKNIDGKVAPFIVAEVKF